MVTRSHARGSAKPVEDFEFAEKSLRLYEKNRSSLNALYPAADRAFIFECSKMT
jgi:hypothetical protein